MPDYQCLSSLLLRPAPFSRPPLLCLPPAGSFSSSFCLLFFFFYLAISYLIFFLFFLAFSLSVTPTKVSQCGLVLGWASHAMVVDAAFWGEGRLWGRSKWG